MATKKELIAQAKGLGLTVTDRMKAEDIQAVIDAHNAANNSGDAPPPPAPPEPPKVPENGKKVKFSEDLKQTVQKNKHILSAWVNAAGAWYFCKKPGFTAYTRDEILNG